MQYDLFCHRHNFAVWAAARAAQRGFAPIETLKGAVESSGLVFYVRDHAADPIDHETFAVWHSTWCGEILHHLDVAGVARSSFGRAAKLVAVYLKAMVVVGPFAENDLAFVAHPPIDRLLLQALSRLDYPEPEVRRILRTTNWTTLDRASYYALIETLRGAVRDIDPFWRIEQHWTVTQLR